jgi:mycoredoxin
MADRSSTEHDELPDAITFYWRPGCGFCRMLERDLLAWGVPLDRRNIWEEPEAAAAVRAVANGNETVPTVVVGPVSMVNPTAEDVATALAEHAPHLLPEGFEPTGARFSKLARRILGG